MFWSVKNWNACASLFLVGLLPPASAPAAHDSVRVKTILIVGDSLSDGFRLSRSEAYPALLAAKLRAAALDYDIINASQSGGTSGGGLRRLTPLLKRKIDIF